jgi:ABC-2 type transport system ATP-binding protein
MDVETRRASGRHAGAFAAEGRTILFATHYLEGGRSVADRIVVSTTAGSSPTARPAS